MWINRSEIHIFFLKGSLLFLGLCFSFLPLEAQKKSVQSHGRGYESYIVKASGISFQAFDYDLSRQPLRACYFGTDAKSKYDAWKKHYKRRILCYFAVGFAEQNDRPLGISAENGTSLNRNWEQSMDGLIQVDAYGKLTFADLERERVAQRYDLKSASDRSRFMRQLPRSRGSIFQTQLMYSHLDGRKMGPEKYGERASRRFMAVCRDKGGHVHYIILEQPKSMHLNKAAVGAIACLSSVGYEILYLFNHDTGSRNVMQAFDQKGKRLYRSPMELSKATQLLVFYVP